MTHPPLPPIPAAPPMDLALPRRFERLGDLAHNLWWSWDAGARQLWQRIAPMEWDRSRNPFVVLQTASPEVWRHLETDPSFSQAHEDVIARFDSYMDEPDTWFATRHPGRLGGGVAYLSAEFGLHSTLPFYSGGLGVLAGDHVKAASDLGVPLVGVGLLYRRGYFGQTIDPDGVQQHRYRPIEIARLGLRRVEGPSGHPLTVGVDLPGRRVEVGAWRLDVGRVPIILLDTDVPSNDPADRPITHILYVRGREMRLCQEIVLGVAGVRVLAALGISPDRWHVNEGHAALSLLERVRGLVAEGSPAEAAMAEIKRRSSFTLHTPVPAGNEVFDSDLASTYLGSTLPELPGEAVLSLGASDSGGFDLGALAIRLSATTNGVSQRHGEVVSREWSELIGGPASHVTNGVHIPTWVGMSVARRLESALGDAWRDLVLEPDAWEALRRLPPRDVWDAHLAQKEQLLRDLRTRIRDQRARHGVGPDELRDVMRLLPVDRLTIVFARRFAAYKRAGLVLSDLDRLERLLKHPERPVQLIFCGKAHPADGDGKQLVKEIMEMTTSQRFRGHISLIEDYDIALGAALVSGADVWLNTPRPPLEASGTSGMKAAANGVLNLSILDGWWLEGFDGRNGWGLEGDATSEGADAAALYDVLEGEVVPLYYDREGGIPLGWVERMREAIISVAPAFSASRMVADYVERYYLAD